MRHEACPNPACIDVGKIGAGNIIGHASFNTEAAPGQQCRCKTCGRTFSANTGTAYAGLHGSRDDFDQVATMRVEGVSISAISRITGRSRSASTRWLERAAVSAERFNDEHLRTFELKELQVDEPCTFVGSKTDTVWVRSIIEATSRLWPTGVVGRRSYRNTDPEPGDAGRDHRSSVVISRSLWPSCRFAAWRRRPLLPD